MGEIIELSESFTKDIIRSMNVMTQLARLKYGNLDKDVYSEIEKAEILCNKLAYILYPDEQLRDVE